MRSTKAFCLAALAAVAAMAFIGTSPAAAQTHEITLCKALEELCAAGHLWPSGTEFLALGENQEIKGPLPIKCPDVLLAAKTTAAVALPLPFVINTLEIGKLPTPKLGEGCTGCPFGLKTEIHTSPFVPYKAQSKVENIDKYSILIENFKLQTSCGSIKCGFESKDLASEVIKHDGEHPKHPGATNLPLIPLQAPLTVYEDTSGIGACGKTATWVVTFVITLAHFGAETGLAWPSLDKK